MNIKYFLIFLLLALTACGRSKDPEFYILNPLPIQKNTLQLASRHTHLEIGIDIINTPAYTEKVQLMVFHTPNQVTLEEYHQWAETLDKNIKRVIKSNLSTLLPGAAIETAPWDIIFKPTYHVQITISDFTIDLSGKSTLSANYVVYDQLEAIKKESRYYQLKLTNPTIKELVSSMNTNLTRLTKDMAAMLAALPVPPR